MYSHMTDSAVFEEVVNSKKCLLDIEFYEFQWYVFRCVRRYITET